MLYNKTEKIICQVFFLKISKILILKYFYVAQHFLLFIITSKIQIEFKISSSIILLNIL